MLRLLQSTCLVAAAVAAAAYTITPAHAASEVRIEIWDKGNSSMDKLNSEPMRGYDEANLPNPTMGLKVSTQTIKAGPVTFVAVNESKDLVHEMIISPLPNHPLPYTAEEMKVDEDKAVHLGEVSELPVGQKGELKIDLKPGKYIVYCNMPGHYALGMWSQINVVE